MTDTAKLSMSVSWLLAESRHQADKRQCVRSTWQRRGAGRWLNKVMHERNILT